MVRAPYIVTHACAPIMHALVRRQGCLNCCAASTTMCAVHAVVHADAAAYPPSGAVLSACCLYTNGDACTTICLRVLHVCVWSGYAAEPACSSNGTAQLSACGLHIYMQCRSSEHTCMYSADACYSFASAVGVLVAQRATILHHGAIHTSSRATIVCSSAV